MNRRDLVTLISLSAAGTALAQPAAPAQPNALTPPTSPSLIGVWTLRSCIRTLADGRRQHPFGEIPVGRIEYDRQGRMFALLMRPGRRSTLAPGLDLDAATADDIREAVTGFVAYFGTYAVDEAAHIVTHHVEASLSPTTVGAALHRRFHWDGPRLVLTRAVPGTSDELIWTRA